MSQIANYKLPIATTIGGLSVNLNHLAVDTALFPIPGSPLCPVTTVKALLKQKGRASQPLFALRGGIPFTYPQYQKKLKATLRKAGYNPGAFSSHSVRRGSVLWAYRSGVPESLIAVQGDWRSDCYKRYLTFPMEVRAVVNLKMRKAIAERVLHF